MVPSANINHKKAVGTVERHGGGSGCYGRAQRGIVEGHGVGRGGCCGREAAALTTGTAADRWVATAAPDSGARGSVNDHPQAGFWFLLLYTHTSPPRITATRVCPHTPHIHMHSHTAALTRAPASLPGVPPCAASSMGLTACLSPGVQQALPEAEPQVPREPLGVARIQGKGEGPGGQGLASGALREGSAD